MNDDLIEKIEGDFVHTVFRTDSYMVCRFRTGDYQITVTGPSFDYEKNQKYVLTGSYAVHPKYGRQFNFITIEKKIPTNEEEIISFLSSKTFHGIGKKTAEKIYEIFGDETLGILKNEFSRIYETGLSDRQIASLQEGFDSLNDPENETIFYLVSNGLNNNEAHIIYNRFKDSTMDVIHDNPFRLYLEIYSIGFEKIRQFAQKMEFDDAEHKYAEAFLVYLITDHTFNSGNMYIEYDELVNLLTRAGFTYDPDEILERAYDNHYLCEEEGHIYLFSDYHDEKYIADYLNGMSGGLILEEEKIDEALEEVQNVMDITYDEEQKKAIRNFLTNQFSIIIGGPGTGKTTIIKTMAYIFNNYLPFNNLIVAAPTGRAAKRINEMCNVESKTIHSLLKWDKHTNTFIFNTENPILYDAIIIDEFSMVDNSLFAALLKASSRVKKICVIGDDNQLPSIKPGNLLLDLMESDRFPLTSLHNNYRQEEGSEIIDLASDIINNDIDLSRYTKDILFYDPGKNDFDIVSLINEDLLEGYELDDIQVLSPMHKGEWGIDNLNNILQQAFNPRDYKKKEKQVGGTIYREFDKILQLKNRQTDDVYNGDIGMLIEVNDKEKYLLVDFNDTYVFYQYDDLEDISLAYAMSVHKAQGSEYQIVYFIMSRNNLHMLNNKLIYTAISRAKKKLVIISEENLFIQGISNKLRKRKTTLLRRLNNE